jgi:1-acyl-sn-glycerol-3-phosphate acyltransferase
MRRLRKIAGMIPMIVAFIATAILLRLFVRDDVKWRRRTTRLVSKFCGWALVWLGIHVSVKRAPKTDLAGFVVSNHLSYIDVFAIASVLPTLFVTSVEMEQTPLLGYLSELGGSLFVERRKAIRLRQDMDRLSELLDEGQRVVLFPEGTSGDGRDVKPFKAGLLSVAMPSRKPVVPICINYLRVNGRPVNAADRDKLFFYGEIGFGAHVKKFLAWRSVELELKILPPVAPHANEDVKAYVKRLENIVRAEYAPV